MDEAVIGLDTQFVVVLVGALVVEPVPVFRTVLVIRGLLVIVAVFCATVLV